ncbi:MAG: hypothetical protein IJ174_04205 [Clostridia bacterium]|nr:hypothetical protein [Clostridia bacterium]
MKYGESTFDILYLLFATVSGVLLLRRAKDRAGKRMGLAALILGVGDAFHLVPRVLNYFVQGDFTAVLGIGKLVTSITLTVFYVLMYAIWLDVYREKEDRTVTLAVLISAAIRIALCLFPQNGWLENSSGLLWSVLRNVPFTALGTMVCFLYYQKRKAFPAFRYVWLYILLSFLFYLPVALGAGAVPILGMLMLPKTICYVLIILAFHCAVKG